MDADGRRFDCRKGTQRAQKISLHLGLGEGGQRPKEVNPGEWRKRRDEVSFICTQSRRNQPPRRFSSKISTGIEWSSRQTIWMGRSDWKLTSFAGPRNVKGVVIPPTFLRERTKNSIV